MTIPRKSSFYISKEILVLFFGRFRARLSLQKIAATRQIIHHNTTVQYLFSPGSPSLGLKNDLHSILNCTISRWKIDCWKKWLSLRMIKRLMIERLRDCGIKLCYWIVSRRLTGTRFKGGRGVLEILSISPWDARTILRIS